VRRIHFDGAHFRKDIGSLGLRRIQSTLQSQRVGT
jgi:hypothetical protein